MFIKGPYTYYLIPVLFLIMGTSQNVFSQANKYQDTHPIDKKYAECLASWEGRSTAGKRSCSFEARKSWESEMNKYLLLLKSKLSKEQQIKLNASQKNWKLYKEEEFKLAGSIYGEMDEESWLEVLSERNTNLVRERTMDLIDYYNDIMNNEIRN